MNITYGARVRVLPVRKLAENTHTHTHARASRIIAYVYVRVVDTSRLHVRTCVRTGVFRTSRPVFMRWPKIESHKSQTPVKICPRYVLLGFVWLVSFFALSCFNSYFSPVFFSRPAGAARAATGRRIRAGISRTRPSGRFTSTRFFIAISLSLSPYRRYTR